LTEAAGVGARLRQAREEQGLAIDDVALQLKFAPRQIEFLEQERFDRLPGPTIARGMVRNYARLLKLDAEPLIQRMAPHAEPAPDPGLIAARFRQEVPFSDSGKRSTLIYAGFSVALLVLVGALAYEWQQQKAPPRIDGSVPTQTYRIEVGHAHGVLPGNIVGAIANETGVSGRLVGAIRIDERHSLVDVPDAIADRVVAALRGTYIKGKRLPIRRDQRGLE